MKRFALIGNPNCGKTTLFNNLTGSTAHVGNWPGVTVDKKEGVYKKASEPVSVIDLPGIYSLSPYTPEEVISRNFILDEKPDCVINIVDSTNLERNLYLTTQIMEIDVPIVIALNFLDALEKNGDYIDVKKLEERIGLPIVSISALRQIGIDELMQKAISTSNTQRKGNTILEKSELMPLVNDCKIALENQGIDNPLSHAIKLVELDKIEMDAYPSPAQMVKEFKKCFTDNVFGSDLDAIIADGRYKYISAHYSPVLKHRTKFDADNLTKSDKADKVLTHKIWGIPIFLLILFAIFHLTFSTNFLFLGAALPSGWVSLADTPAEGLFGTDGIASPGVIMQNAVILLTDTITNAIRNAMNSGNTAAWAVGLVCDGILGGLFSVFSFIPQILLLFLFFSILEDSGYMARIAFILDRFLHRFGLSGRALMPMIMGWGCSVPAMINTRTLADEKEKIATIRVIPFFSCGAKLPLLLAISGGIANTFHLPHTDFITYGMYAIGMVVAICAVLLMRLTTMKGDSTPFIMELPAYHAPQIKNLALHLWNKLKHFIQKAFTIILASTIVIWFVSHFNFSWNYLPDNNMDESILAGIGKLIQPLFTPLGFGSQLGSSGWVFVVAAFAGLIAKENVVATLGALASCIINGMVDIHSDGGVEYIYQMIITTEINVPALIAFIAFNMLTIPCISAVATAKAELPTKKSFIFTILFWVATSYFVSSAIYIIGTWWWTVFVYLAFIAIVIMIIVLENKNILNVKKIKNRLKIGTKRHK